MSLDLDTFLTALYTAVDDLYRAHIRPCLPTRPGPQPQLSDSEVLTLALLAQWQPFGSERAFCRWAQRHLRPYFPSFVTQSRFNRRVRLLVQALGMVFRCSADLSAPASPYRIIDATPVPVAKVPRMQRNSFRGQAALSWCGAKKEWYFGFKLMLAVTPEGAITSAALLPANVGDRPGAATIFEQEQHPYYLADKGFCSATWEQEWLERYGVHLLAAPFKRHRRAWSVPYARAMSSRRQIIETINNILKDLFGLEQHRARTYTGLLARIGAKLAACMVGQQLNLLYGRRRLSFATLWAW